MSRLGKKPIEIPKTVQAKIDNNVLIVKGPKGQLQLIINPLINVKMEGEKISITINDQTDKTQKALWGLFASLIRNMIAGVTEGFEKKLEINGIGFKAAVAGKKLVLNVGFSHPVEFSIPENISIAVEKNIITVSGFDKQLVGETAAQIRRIKKPEPYKGKGIKYIDEVIRRKEGKVVKGSS